MTDKKDINSPIKKNVSRERKDIFIPEGKNRKNVVNVKYMVDRYANDPEYKEYRKKKAREYYKKKKLSKLQTINSFSDGSGSVVRFTA
jgi:hypothetical protein